MDRSERNELTPQDKRFVYLMAWIFTLTVGPLVIFLIFKSSGVF